MWRESLDEQDDVENGVQGLGGWLFLFGIGRVLAVFSWIFALAKDLLIVAKPGLWSALTTPGSKIYRPYWFTVLVYETSGNVLCLLLSVCLVALFFARWKIFRPLVIVYLIGMTGFLWGDYLLTWQITTIPAPARSQAWGSCIAATLCALLWVPYFLVSTRVERTFVK